MTQFGFQLHGTVALIHVLLTLCLSAEGITGHRVHSVLDKSLKMLDFGIKTSRPLKVLENR